MSIAFSKIVYTKDDLLALKRIGNGVIHPIPPELRKLFHGYRAGAQLKARR